MSADATRPDATPTALALQEGRRQYRNLTVWQIGAFLAAWISLFVCLPYGANAQWITVACGSVVLAVLVQKDRLLRRLCQRPQDIDTAAVVGQMDRTFWICFFAMPVALVLLCLLAIAKACSTHSCC